MGIFDFWRGYEGRDGSHLIVRDLEGQLDYETGRRIGRRRLTRPALAPLSDSLPFFKACFVCAALGSIGGLGYGVWATFTDQVAPGLAANAMTALRWTGIGAGAGALVPPGLIVAACLAILGGIFYGLGLLLNFLTSL